MKPSYFREQKHYSLIDIQRKLCVPEEKCKQLLGILKKYGVVKTVDRNKPEYEDLSDLDVILSDVSDNSQVAYKFSFVGVILVENSVFCCYPKYIDNNDYPEQELKTVLDVIRKYDSQEQLIHLYNGSDENKVFNRMAVGLYLLHDYFDNGIYTNQQTIIEINGEGEILWDNTINETFAFIKKNTPYYVELQTVNTLSNELDYFKLLNECILTMCSNELKEAGLLSLFDLAEVELSGQKLEDFGDANYIKHRLEKEIQTQYVTKKQILLKTLYTFISEISSNETSNSFSLYGTNSFNLVWEKACSEIFESVRDTSFKELKKRKIIDDRPIKNPNYDLELDNPGKEYLSDSKQLKDLIEQITWIFNEHAVKAAETLEPDIISILDKGFYILDAKYYIINIDENGIHQQPGIQDIVKQFAYHRAFCNFINEYKFETVNNAFLVPQTSSNTIDDNFHIAGEAKLKLMQYYTLKPLSPIQIVELKPSFVYKHYLESKKCTEKLESLVSNAKKRNNEFFGDSNGHLQQVAEDPKSKLKNNEANDDITYYITHKKRGF